MDTKRLKELIEFMKENALVELEVEEEGKKIKLTRGDLQKPISSIMPAPSQDSQTQEAKGQSQTLKENLLEIKAPMVGTFYRAPAPNNPAYVEIESAISPGEVVCIIEAMKLMNEIKSEVKGKIVDILAENGEPVEYGQTLFLVKPL